MTELPILQPERSCGSCTMCCKLLGVTELEKMPGVWCQHCNKGHGCKIYADRPPTCQDFECLWLMLPDLPIELRPDHCKVVLSTTSDEEGIVAFVDTAYPMAHRQGLMGEYLKAQSSAANMVIIAVIGQERELLFSGTNLPEKYREMIENIRKGNIKWHT